MTSTTEDRKNRDAIAAIDDLITEYRRIAREWRGIGEHHEVSALIADHQVDALQAARTRVSRILLGN